MGYRSVVTLARTEFRAACFRRVAPVAAAYAALGALLTWLSAPPAGYTVTAAGQRSAAALVHLSLLAVPLAGLLAGALAVAGDRERRTLAYLLAQPVSRDQVVLAKFLGLSWALAASLLAALGTVGLWLAWMGLPLPAGSFLILAAFVILLALASVALGLALSCALRRSATAVAAALAAWTLLVYLGDLGLLAAATARLDPRGILAASLLNPAQLFRVGVLAALGPAPDVLGPVGLFAQDLLGSALIPALAMALAAWTGAALAAAVTLFRQGEVT